MFICLYSQMYGSVGILQHGVNVLNDDNKLQKCYEGYSVQTNMT